MNIIGNVCINHIKEGDEDNEDYSANGSSSDETETGCCFLDVSDDSRCCYPDITLKKKTQGGFEPAKIK